MGVTEIIALAKEFGPAGAVAVLLGVLLRRDMKEQRPPPPKDDWREKMSNDLQALNIRVSILEDRQNRRD